MKTAKMFVFDSYQLDPIAHRVTFRYVIIFEDETSEDFTTILSLPSDRLVDWNTIPITLQTSLFQALHLINGIAYWKMYCPPHIELRSYALSTSQADFWNTVYTKGLGQFFYENNLDFRGLIQFPSQANTPSASTPFPRTDRSLTPIGGGKDSITTIELLKEHQKPFDLYSIGTSTIQDRTAALVDRGYIQLRQSLDQTMIERSKQGDVYNGHVPISVVYTFTGLLCAVLYDYRYIVFSNERSANIGNVEYLGQEINHQWSKSAEFEKMARDYIHTFITPDITPFSLLRPLSELEIVRRFCAYPQYFDSFSSCNRNFTISKPRPDSTHRAYWCGTCPKCAFVFACLAAFLPKETVVHIFGKNLYTDTALLQLYSELLGTKGFKPFECVGTPEEMMIAMYLAHEKGEFKHDAIMNLFEQRVLPMIQDIETMKKNVFAIEDTSTLPNEFQYMYETR